MVTRTDSSAAGDAKNLSTGKGMALDQTVLLTTLMTIYAAFPLAIETGTWMEHCLMILGSVAKVIFGEFLVITTTAFGAASLGCLM
ncbi:hypothetical protein LTR95_017683, partial [Oleoguttula sp. CCFEE 5521]